MGDVCEMRQLHEKISAMNKNYYDLRGKIVSAERRIKVLDEHLSMWEQNEKHKGIRRQLDKVKPQTSLKNHSRTRTERRRTTSYETFSFAYQYPFLHPIPGHADIRKNAVQGNTPYGGG